MTDSEQPAARLVPVPFLARYVIPLERSEHGGHTRMTFVERETTDDR